MSFKSLGWVFLFLQFFYSNAFAFNNGPINPSIDPSYQEIHITGDPVQNQQGTGIFDPAITYALDGTGYMLYSKIFHYYSGPTLDWSVSNHLAKSTDNGLSWDYQGVINQSHWAWEEIDPGNPGSLRYGIWRHETSSLAYHDGKWKMVWWKFFHVPGVSGFHLQKIYYKETSSSDPVNLQYEPKIELSWAALNLLANPNFAQDLADQNFDQIYTLFAEPGTLVKNGKLYVTLQGHKGLPPVDPSYTPTDILLYEIVPNGMEFKGVLLSTFDASWHGHANFWGASLTSARGKDYIMAAAIEAGEISVGTAVFEIEDLETATLKRNPNGKAVLKKFINLPINAQKGGQATYHEENLAGGMVMPAITLDGQFRLFKSYVFF